MAQVFNFPNQGVMLFNQGDELYEFELARPRWVLGMGPSSEFIPYRLMIDLTIFITGDKRTSYPGHFELRLYFTQDDYDFAARDPRPDAVDPFIRFAIWKNGSWNLLPNPTLIFFEFPEVCTGTCKKYIGYAIFLLDQWGDPTISVGK